MGVGVGSSPEAYSRLAKEPCVALLQFYSTVPNLQRLVGPKEDLGDGPNWTTERTYCNCRDSGGTGDADGSAVLHYCTLAMGRGAIPHTIHLVCGF